MTTLGLGFGMAGSLARDSLTGFDTDGSQQQPAGSATFSGAFAGPHPQPDLPSALASTSATQQASTSAGAGPPQHPEDAGAPSAGTLVEHTPVSGRTRWMSSAAARVSGDGRHDRAHLLVAGQHQEGRGTAIGLDADGVEARLRMGEFAVAVRRHGSARVQVRVDQWPECLGAFEPRDRGRAAARGSGSGPGAVRSQRRSGRRDRARGRRPRFRPRRRPDRRRIGRG